MKNAPNIKGKNQILDLRDYALVALARDNLGRDEASKVGLLIEMGVRLSALQNYRDSFKEHLGWNSASSGPRNPLARPVEQLIRTISRDLGPGILDFTGNLEAAGRVPPDPGELAVLLKIPDAKIAHWLGKIAAREAEVQRHPIYKAALQAYEADDQKALGPLIRSVFSFDSREVLSAGNSRRPLFLFHGIKIQPEETAGSYVDKIESILEHGLLPSRPGHARVDSRLRPVFSVPDPAHTHGIAYFELDLRGSEHTVFVSADMYPAVEGNVYTKCLKIPMRLLVDLRPAEKILNAGSLTEISAHRTPEELELFRRDALGEMSRRNIKWDADARKNP